MISGHAFILSAVPILSAVNITIRIIIVGISLSPAITSIV